MQAVIAKITKVLGRCREVLAANDRQIEIPSSNLPRPSSLALERANEAVTKLAIALQVRAPKIVVEAKAGTTSPDVALTRYCTLSRSDWDESSDTELTMDAARKAVEVSARPIRTRRVSSGKLPDFDVSSSGRHRHMASCSCRPVVCPFGSLSP